MSVIEVVCCYVLDFRCYMHISSYTIPCSVVCVVSRLCSGYVLDFRCYVHISSYTIPCSHVCVVSRSCGGYVLVFQMLYAHQ